MYAHDDSIMLPQAPRFIAGPHKGQMIPRFPPRYGWVYLIHFHTPLKHAKHYLGSAACLDFRIAQHRSGTGARLMEVVTQEGITWDISRIWRCDSPQAARVLEAKLKRRHSGVELCPRCQGKPEDPEALLYQGHWPFHLFDQHGRRRPIGEKQWMPQ